LSPDETPGRQRLVRVHQLAKELGWTSKQALDYLQARGEYVTSPQSAIADIVVRDIRREFATAPSDAADERLSPAMYGHSAVVADAVVDDGETWEQALRRAQAESQRAPHGRSQRPLHPVVRALLDEVIVPRRDHDNVPTNDTGYFPGEIREAKRLHKAWVAGQLNGLPDDDRTVIEWIRLTWGERADLAAELAAAGVTPAEAALRLGYGSRIDPRRDTIFGRYRNRQISKSEAVSQVWQWRRRRDAS
jgi:hypothetical protein